jgi:glutamate carboxypeptidase
LGFSAEFVPSENLTHGDHLFLSCGDPELPPVVLVTHLDTVFPPEEEIKNDFRWLEAPSEGRIYGPGTVDIKGGTVLIWMLVRALQMARPQVFERHRWVIAANASEEVIGAEFGRRTEERVSRGARAVLVFEGGPREGDDFHLVTARKGRALYRLQAEGRAAHAGSAHASGANAIVALAGAVQAAARITDYARDLTVNVGSIGGGSVVNRVPQEAWADLEMRAFKPEVLDAACRQIEALAAAPASSSEARMLVDCTGTSPAWPASPTALALLEHWRGAAATLGLRIKNVSRGGLSDANYLCNLGPTLDGLGPSGANAHCSERTEDGIKVPEYVEPGSFAPKAELNVLALCSLLESQE